jgi:mannose-6-phosphate isomerase-like protein (cupin superfamily)
VLDYLDPNIQMYLQNIERDTLANKYYRKVIHTTKHQQLVLMSLEPGETIPLEKHNETTQFFRIESGTGVAVLGNKKYKLKPDYALIVPPNTVHEIIQTGNEPLKLYTIYSPPEHPKNRKQLRQSKN